MKTLSNNPKWKEAGEEDAKTFGLDFSVNGNGIQTFTKADTPWRAWLGSSRGYTLAKLENDTYTGHAMGLSRREALEQLSKK